MEEQNLEMGPICFVTSSKCAQAKCKMQVWSDLILSEEGLKSIEFEEECFKQLLTNCFGCVLVSICWCTMTANLQNLREKTEYLIEVGAKTSWEYVFKHVLMMK